MFVTKKAAYRPLNTSEAHFESIILQMSDLLFSDWVALRWKQRVFTPEGRGVEPDMVLLSRDSFDWTVVEVELEHHSISGHIDDQLERLSRARYGYELVPSLVAKGIPEADAREYLRRRPGMLCILDGGGRRVSDCCQAHGFDMAVMAPFLGDRGEPAVHVLSLPGQYRKQEGGRKVDFVFRHSADTIFGLPALTVPDGFPEVDTFSLRIAGTVAQMRIASFGGGRITFAPEGLEIAMDGLRLSAIDPTASLFELVRD